MPAIVKYKTGYPSASKPVQQSGSIDASGIANGQATFIIGENARPFSQGQEFNQNLLTAFTGIQLSKLYVESVSYRKENGLHYCDLAVIGTTAKPVITKASDWSVRSYSVSFNMIDGTTAFRSFDYYSETITWNWVVAKGTISRVATPTEARFGSKFNERGVISRTVIVPGANNSIVGSQTQTITFRTVPLYITTASEETRDNLVYHTAKIEALYQQ